jgi:hypothetical protein
MFSVGLLYSTRDFLKLVPEAGMTVSDFVEHFRTFRSADPQQIIDISFKCGWSKLDPSGEIRLAQRGSEIASHDYQPALLMQIEDLISNSNPVWGSLLIKGRTEAANYLPPDVLQCFKESGLFGKLTDEIVAFWDKLALAYRNCSQKTKTETGRKGEKLSFEFELNRTGREPLWQAVESNLAGYDLLSVVSETNSQKLMIEVKASTASLNYAKVHISRNEWNTASTSRNFLFHLWHLETSPNLYEVQVAHMGEHIPTNNSAGSWESVEIPFVSLI